MPYTQLVVVPPLDLEPEELDLGDRLDFLTKMNSQMSKLQAWAALFETSVNSINALGAELEATQLDDAADIAARLPLAGGTMTGNLTIDKVSPAITLKRANTAEYMTINFQDEAGDAAAEIFIANNATKNINIRHRSGATINNSVYMSDTLTSFSKEVRGVAGANSASLVTKGQMEGDRLAIAGGTITGTLEVDGSVTSNNALFVSKSGASALVHIDALTTNYAAVQMEHAGVVNGVLATDTSRLLLNYKGGASDNYLSIYETYSHFIKEVRGVDSANSGGFMTKAYIDQAIADAIAAHVTALHP